MKKQTQAQKLIRLSEVQERTGLSRSKLYAMQANGEFPKGVKLSDGGSAVSWIESEVNDWIWSRIKVRNAGAKS